MRGVVQEIDGCEQGLSIRMATGPLMLHDPGVAALFFRCLELTAGEPDDGMPPEQDLAGKLQHADPVVAAGEVR